MKQARQTYTGEFKREAVELVMRSGKSMAEVERELGLSKGLLKQWVRDAKRDGEQAFPGKGRLKADDERVRRLERELAAAKPYLERALAIREAVLGKEHPDTATSLNNLGMLLKKNSDLAAAKSYLERALAIFEKSLGSGHPSTQTVRSNLAALQ